MHFAFQLFTTSYSIKWSNEANVCIYWGGSLVWDEFQQELCGLPSALQPFLGTVSGSWHCDLTQHHSKAWAKWWSKVVQGGPRWWWWKMAEGTEGTEGVGKWQMLWRKLFLDRAWLVRPWKEDCDRGLIPLIPSLSVTDISYRLIDLSTCRLLSMFCVQVLGAKLSKLDGLLYKALCICSQ